MDRGRILLRLTAVGGPARAAGPFEIADVPAVLGRAPRRGVTVPDATVSREHARIERRGEGYWVVDLGSRNGTFVDGRRVQDAPLRDGCELRLGGVRLRVEISDPRSDAVEEIVLEEEPTPPPRAAAEAERTMVVPPRHRPRAPERPAVRPVRPPPRPDRAGTLLTEDLSQRPLAGRLLALLAALAVAAVLFVAAERIAETVVPEGEVPGAVPVDERGLPIPEEETDPWADEDPDGPPQEIER